MGYPAFQRARALKFVRRSGSDIGPLTANTWTAVDSSVLNITLEAQAGDVIECSAGWIWGSSASGQIDQVADIATIVSGAVVTWFSSGSSTQASNGHPSFFGQTMTAGQNQATKGTAMLTLAAGDIANGQVTLRLYAKVGSTISILSGAGNPIFFSAKNLGPQDPN